ncbi:MAG: UDP-N-acetylglucosamine 2-epimerase (non-hydrolyzing), partial [Proteobacteria bacterium]|nr:UDP-N-acetylglucosamine 2-epimerase (non-hydrolyzing) [Pseudomonadota bacterium]
MDILIIFGTRPEAIKLAPVVKSLIKTFSKAQVKVCVTAQHRWMLDSVLELFAIKPDYDLNIMKVNQSLSELTANILNKLHELFQTFRPDMILVHGDTTTTLAASLAAFYAKILLCHVEAGLRSENIISPWPEELNRRVTSMIAQYHFAPTQLAADNLLKEGVSQSRIMVTGNTVIDALFQVRNRLNEADLALKMKSLFSFLEEHKKLILVTGHRRENFGAGFDHICEALAYLAGNSELQIVYPVHLNPNVQAPVFKHLRQHKNIFL